AQPPTVPPIHAWAEIAADDAQMLVARDPLEHVEAGVELARVDAEPQTGIEADQPPAVVALGERPAVRAKDGDACLVRVDFRARLAGATVPTFLARRRARHGSGGRLLCGRMDTPAGGPGLEILRPVHDAPAHQVVGRSARLAAPARQRLRRKPQIF